MGESTPTWGAAPVAGVAQPSVLRAILAHPLAPVVLLVLAYAAATRALAPALGLRWGRSDTTVLGMAAVCLLPFLLSIPCVLTVGAWRAWRAGSDVVSGGAQALLAHLRRAGPPSAVVALCAGLVLHASTTWRSSIAALVPFWADAPLHRLDVALHGGAPWTHLAGLYAVPGAVHALVLVYERLWFAGAIMVAPLAVLGGVGSRAQRILLTHALTYIVLAGPVALALSSAGPVYYGAVVGGPDPYAALVALLDAATEPTTGPRAMQRYLWDHHVAGTASLATGITAFPSMHLATATVLALAAGAWRRWAGVVGWALVAVMLVGSVLLAWHYAVDGYAGIAGAALIWYAVGRWQRRGHGRANSRVWPSVHPV